MAESFVGPSTAIRFRREGQRRKDHLENGSRGVTEFVQDLSVREESSESTARQLLLLSAALYGTAFETVKVLDDRLGVGLSTCLRFAFAALSMSPFLLAPLEQKEEPFASQPAPREKPITTKISIGLAGMEVGFYNAFGYLFQAISLKTTSAGKSAFICSLALVTVPFLDYVSGKPLTKRQIAGACIATVGVGALELGGGVEFGKGDVLSLLQPLFFGIGFWRMENAMRRFPYEARRLASVQLITIFTVSVAYLICWSPLLTDSCSILPSYACFQDPVTLSLLLYSGVITTALTVYLETVALRSLSAAETTLIFSTEPLFGAGFAYVVANECLGSEGLVGAVLIIAGCLISNMGTSNERDKSTPI